MILTAVEASGIFRDFFELLENYLAYCVVRHYYAIIIRMQIDFSINLLNQIFVKI